MSVRPNLHEAGPAVVVLHESTCDGECRYCHHPIALFNEVGWIDRTPAIAGGSYDMCAAATSGQHEPR